MALVLLAEPLDGARARGLVEALVRDLQVRYEDDGAAGTALLPASFAPPHGAFLVALLDGVPAGCGGVRRRSGSTGEVKRMYVAPSARGRGVARALLAGLEEAAGGLGLDRLVLETGLRQPEAVALYASSGWTRVSPYGEWADSPLSVCFGKDLPAPPATAAS